MARDAVDRAGLTRAVCATLLTIIAQVLLTLVVARYDWLSPFNGLWMLGVPVGIGLLVFRTWPAKLWSMLPLLAVGVAAIAATGLIE
jgi:hypothetical protein